MRNRKKKMRGTGRLLKVERIDRKRISDRQRKRTRRGGCRTEIIKLTTTGAENKRRRKIRII